MVDWRKITVADNVGFYKLPFLFMEVLATLTESRTEGELQMNGNSVTVVSTNIMTITATTIV